MTATIPETARAATCPPWCISDHSKDIAAWQRDHWGAARRVPTTPRKHGPAVTVYMAHFEYTDPAEETRRGTGPMVVLGGHGTGRTVLLKVRDATALAAIMEQLGQGDVAEALRAAVDDLTGGAA